MGYWLGIDVGSTFTAAAVCRGEGQLPEVVALGDHSAVVGSVVYLGAGGQVVVGEAAQRRAVTDPDRVVRGFKARIGDEVPMLIGGLAYTAPQIAAILIRWVIDQVSAREAGPATGIVLTHPAGWGTYKIQTIAAVLTGDDLPEITFRAEPEAAARSHELREDIKPGSTLAVYDLGGTTFDATVVRKNADGTYRMLGHSQRLDSQGGVDFDDAVFAHVVSAVPALTELHPEDPATLAAFAAVRRECAAAKEALSADTEVTIPVLAPGICSRVRMIRAEFEDLIRPQVEQTVQALRRALTSAQLTPSDLDVVLLIGGSSRVPLVAQLVSAALGRPVAIGTDPQTAIALGAACSALPDSGAEDTASDTAVRNQLPEEVTAFDAAMPAPVEAPQRPALTCIPLEIGSVKLQRRRAPSRHVKRLAMAGSLALLAAAAATIPFLPAGRAATPQGRAPIPTPATANLAAPPGSDSNHSSPSGNLNEIVVARPATASTTPTGGTAGAGTNPVRTASSWTGGLNTVVPASNPGGSTSAPNGDGGSAPMPNVGSMPAPAADGGGNAPAPAGNGATAAPVSDGNTSGTSATTAAPGGGSTTAAPGTAAPGAGGGTTPTPDGGGATTTPGGNSGSTTTPGAGNNPAAPGGGNTPPSGGGGATTDPGSGGTLPGPGGGTTPLSGSDGTTPPQGASGGTTSAPGGTPPASGGGTGAPSDPPAKAT